VNGIETNAAFSLLNHPGIAQKLRFEMAHTMIVVELFHPVFDELCDICVYVRENGLNDLHDLKDKTGSQFLKNMLHIACDGAFRQNLPAPLSLLSYWVLPTLLSGAVRGKAFIESILYYEGLLMAVSGNVTPGMIRFRLMGLLGIQLSLDECMRDPGDGVFSRSDTVEKADEPETLADNAGPIGAGHIELDYLRPQGMICIGSDTSGEHCSPLHY
jgi:hypothetical protein